MKSILIILFLSPIFNIFAQNTHAPEVPYIEVEGYADTLLIPNKISLNIKISENDSKNKIPLERMEVQMFEALKSIGINVASNLEVNDFSSDFKNQFLRSKEIVKEKSYTLIVSNAKLLGAVAKKLEEINISNIGIIKVELSNEKEIRELLDQKAIINAKRKADNLLQILGHKRGPALHIYSVNEPLFAARTFKYDRDITINDPQDGVNFTKIELVSRYKILFKIL